jgi:hypothetical protein
MKQEFSKQGSVKRRTETLFILAILAGFCWLNTSYAAEVYTWTDQDGVTHFSDMPPESGNAQQIEVEEAYFPGSSGAYTEDEGAAPDPSGEDDNPMTENPQKLADQKREQLAKDRKARREAQAETAALCEQNRQLLERLEPSRRVFYTNEQGEEVRMDDEQRVGLVAEAKDFVAKNCE